MVHKKFAFQGLKEEQKQEQKEECGTSAERTFWYTTEKM